MKIACQSCQAKYTIADEKVLGRVVKIRCKKCGATIVINGNEAADSALSPPDDATAVAQGSASAGGAFDYSAPQGDEWTVNVGEGDQRTMRLAQIVSEYKAGVVNDETYCWKDGMTDWLPLREISALSSACAAGTSAAPPANNRFEAPIAAAAAGASGAIAEANGGAGPFTQTSSTAAARRTGGRGTPGADLFSNAADAGGENDVLTSAPQGAPQAHENGEAKLTGQRNENSVLFSLSALTSGGPKEVNGSGPSVPTQGDGSGLIDIRALASSVSTSKDKSSHVDDIMNLGGGGAFTAALAAPVLAAPPMEMGETAGAPQKSSKGVLLGLGGVVVALLAVVVVLLVRKPAAVATDITAGTAVTGVTAPALGTTSPTGAVANGTDPATTASAARSADTVSPPPTAAAADTASSKPIAAVVRTSTRSNSHSDNAPSRADNPPVAPPPPTNNATTLEQAMAGVAAPQAPGAPAAGGGGASAQFDRGAAAAALGAVNVDACKKADGPTGRGHVSITFAPGGSVAQVTADEPPYAGTAVGGCVAAKFRTARVPPFSGGAQKVGKSFSIAP